MSQKLKFLAFASIAVVLFSLIFVLGFRSYHKLPSCDSQFAKENVLTEVKSNFDSINRVLQQVNNSYELLDLSDFKSVKSNLFGSRNDCSVNVRYRVSINNNKSDKKEFESSSSVNFALQYKTFSDRRSGKPVIVISESKQEQK